MGSKKFESSDYFVIVDPDLEWSKYGFFTSDGAAKKSAKDGALKNPGDGSRWIVAKVLYEVKAKRAANKENIPIIEV